MNDNNQPEEPGQGGPNPWMKSLMLWGGIFLALLLVVQLPNQRTGLRRDYRFVIHSVTPSERRTRRRISGAKSGSRSDGTTCTGVYSIA